LVKKLNLIIASLFIEIFFYNESKRMSFEDWIKNFDIVDIFNLTPEIISDISKSDWVQMHTFTVNKI